MKEGDGPAAAAKAGLASRTNTLFSGPMLLGMLGSKHLADISTQAAGTVSDLGLYTALGLIVVLEINALFGKMGPMKSVLGVVHCSLLLMAAVLGILLALGILIVLLSSSLIANTLSALLNQHLRHIGVIKLVGGQRRQVVAEGARVAERPWCEVPGVERLQRVGHQKLGPGRPTIARDSHGVQSVE